jgi:hypothetical protein
MSQITWIHLAYSEEKKHPRITDINSTSRPHGDQHIAQLVSQVRVDKGLPKEAFHLGCQPQPPQQ